MAVLAARGSRGVGDDIDGRAIQGPIVPYCTYCIRLCLILAEARVPFQLVMIDRNCKQSWFRGAFPDFTTPAIQGTPGGVDGGAWVGDSKDLLRNSVAQNPRVAAVVSASAPGVLERAEFLGERLKAALIGGRLVGSAHEDGDAFAMECLRRCGKPEEEASGSTNAAKKPRGIKGLIAMIDLRVCDVFGYAPTYTFPGFRSNFGGWSSVLLLLAVFLRVTTTFSDYVSAEPVVSENRIMFERDLETPFTLPKMGLVFKKTGWKPFYDPTYFRFRFQQGDSGRAANSTYEELEDQPCSFVDSYGRIIEDEARWRDTLHLPPNVPEALEFDKSGNASLPREDSCPV